MPALLINPTEAEREQRLLSLMFSSPVAGKPKKKIWCCKECNYSSCDKSLVKRHIEAKHANIKYICEVENCGFSVARLDKYKSHLAHYSHEDDQVGDRARLQQNDRGSQAGPPGGRLVGIVVGSVVAAVIIIALVAYGVTRRQYSRAATAEP